MPSRRTSRACVISLTRAGVRLRAHAKTHKSADIAKYQIEHGGACGVCCQKVSEAEALVDAGVEDVLVSNQVVDLQKIDRLAQMAKKTRVLVCVDDLDNADDLSAAATRHGINIECLVELDCGAGRCGVQWGAPVVEIAKKIAASDSLTFSGIQAYHGPAQHVQDFGERKRQIDSAVKQVADTLDRLKAHGLGCDIVGGAGTGSYSLQSWFILSGQSAMLRSNQLVTAIATSKNFDNRGAYVPSAFTSSR